LLANFKKASPLQLKICPIFITYFGQNKNNFYAVGKGRGILFKHTSEARSLAYKSKLLMLIVSALREIGEDNITEQQLEITKSHLTNVSQKELETDIQLMPLWVRKILLSL
jgi:hypothetical protein